MHKRDVTRALIDKKVDSSTDFEWLAQMRLYFEPNHDNVLEQLKIRMANAEFHYGFEYLGKSIHMTIKSTHLFVSYRFTRSSCSNSVD